MTRAETHSEVELNAQAEIARRFAGGNAATMTQLEHFPPWLQRQDVARFLARYELFKLILDVPGVVLDCGTFYGSSAFSWLHFSSILEPYNHTRRIASFDTFSGFPGVTPNDGSAKPGDFATHGNTKDGLEALVNLHDSNRPIGHLRKLEFVQGVLPDSMGLWLAANPSTLVSLLYLDVDLLTPTIGCLRLCWELVPAGGIVAFDELCCSAYPGETAAIKMFTEGNIPKIHRIGLDPYIAYIRKGESR